MASSRVSGPRLDQLLRHSREPAFWLSPELKVVWVNRAWEKFTGHAAGTVVGLLCRAHGPARDGDLTALAGSLFPPPEALAGRPAAARTLFVHPGGGRHWRRVDFWPFHDDDGAILALLGLVREPVEPRAEAAPEAADLRADLMEIRERLLGRYGLEGFVGRGAAHRRLLDQVIAAAATDVPVLLVGEPGTGRRHAARTIHRHSPRRMSPLLPVDCAALPPDALERALFRPGDGGDGDGAGSPDRLAVPEGSTLLVSDVLDLPRDLQGRLCSALDPRVRLLATTAAEPEAALATERLRTDLFYRLTTFVVRLRPLRDRLDELPLLAQHFLEGSNQRNLRQRGGFQPDALRALLGYDWPGNLRELARVVEDAHARGDGHLVAADDLPASIRGHLGAAYTAAVAPTPAAPLDDLLTQVERRLIESALLRSRHNKSRAAEILGISRPRLYRRIKELNLPDVPDPGEDALPPPESTA